MTLYTVMAAVVFLFVASIIFKRKEIQPKNTGEIVEAVFFSLMVSVFWPITAIAFSLVGVKKAVDKLKS